MTNANWADRVSLTAILSRLPSVRIGSVSSTPITGRGIIRLIVGGERFVSGNLS